MTKLCEHKILSPFTSFDSNRLSEFCHSKQLKPLKKLTIPRFRLKRKIARCCSFSLFLSLSRDGQISDINAATYQVKPATDDSSAGRSKGGEEEGRAASVTTSIFFSLVVVQNQGFEDGAGKLSDLYAYNFSSRFSVSIPTLGFLFLRRIQARHEPWEIGVRREGGQAVSSAAAVKFQNPASPCTLMGPMRSL